MDVNVVSVAFRGQEADATVSFSLKKGHRRANPITMKYAMAREGDEWKIKGRSLDGYYSALTDVAPGATCRLDIQAWEAELRAARFLQATRPWDRAPALPPWVRAANHAAGSSEHCAAAMKVAILGGGPSGAFAAASLAAAGVSATVFDEKLAWEKPCGGGLTESVLAIPVPRR